MMPPSFPYLGGRLLARFEPMLRTTKTVGVRLVTFDLLHTLIAPQAPVHVLYARAFEPLLGPLDHDRIKESFQIGVCTPLMGRGFG